MDKMHSIDETVLEAVIAYLLSYNDYESEIGIDKLIKYMLDKGLRHLSCAFLLTKYGQMDFKKARHYVMSYVNRHN